MSLESQITTAIILVLFLGCPIVIFICWIQRECKKGIAQDQERENRLKHLEDESNSDNKKKKHKSNFDVPITNKQNMDKSSSDDKKKKRKKSESSSDDKKRKRKSKSSSDDKKKKNKKSSS